MSGHGGRRVGAGRKPTSVLRAFPELVDGALTSDNGETSLSFGVIASANATAMIGRCYWKGVLVEDED